MTLRELLIRSHDLPQKESFNFRVEQIGPFLGGAGVLLSREEREVRFLARLVFGVNVFCDTLGHLCFNKGLPGRLYEGRYLSAWKIRTKRLSQMRKMRFCLQRISPMNSK